MLSIRCKYSVTFDTIPFTNIYRREGIVMEELTIEQMYDLLSDENKETIKNQIDVLVKTQSESESSPCSVE